MNLGIHYYVLFINEEVIKLFEGFRDTLIEINEKGFPTRLPQLLSTSNLSEKNMDIESVKPYLKNADQNLQLFYQQDPLKIIVIGIRTYVKMFQSITCHKDHIVGTIPGKFIAEPHVLGKLVWYMMRMKLAKTGEKALWKLAMAANEKNCVSGVHQVWRQANKGKAALLIVENDYTVPGRINPVDQSLIINGEVEITSPLDDLIDIIISKVMENEGRVVFVENGLLKDHDRVALIINDENGKS